MKGGQSQRGPTILGDGTPNLAGSPTPAVYFMLGQCIVAAHLNNSRGYYIIRFWHYVPAVRECCECGITTTRVVGGKKQQENSCQHK